MTTAVLDKKADLAGPAGPGVGAYVEFEKVLPTDYRSLLIPRETQRAIFLVKRFIEDHLCSEINLRMVEVPLIVDVESGVNDMLDRDGSRIRIQSTYPTIAICMLSMPRSCGLRPNGNAWRSTKLLTSSAMRAPIPVRGLRQSGLFFSRPAPVHDLP